MLFDLASRIVSALHTENRWIPDWLSFPVPGQEGDFSSELSEVE
jgi:hypothetical protein